jgi:23S rRNA maturation-related 3'-5' exoribonuclease YhaM
LVWDYDGPKDVNEGQVIVTVSIDTSGVITFAANELLKPAKIVVLKRDNALK